MRNNPIDQIIDLIPVQLRNRYFLVLVLFFAWMIFFDKHDILTQWSLQKTVDQLEEEKDFYNQQIDVAEEQRLQLELNKEKIAREKYYMKRPGEDVFIIVDENEKK
ncbi:MAG: septum formation initiator family protein [Saprospiraceae bacterium]